MRTEHQANLALYNAVHNKLWTAPSRIQRPARKPSLIRRILASLNLI